MIHDPDTVLLKPIIGNAFPDRTGQQSHHLLKAVQNLGLDVRQLQTAFRSANHLAANLIAPGPLHHIHDRFPGAVVP